MRNGTVANHSDGQSSSSTDYLEADSPNSSADIRQPFISTNQFWIQQQSQPFNSISSSVEYSEPHAADVGVTHHPGHQSMRKYWTKPLPHYAPGQHLIYPAPSNRSVMTPLKSLNVNNLDLHNHYTTSMLQVTSQTCLLLPASKRMFKNFPVQSQQHLANCFKQT